MITMKELLNGHSSEGLPVEILSNLAQLQDRVNKIRTAWNRPMQVTSGLRRLEDHIKIYRDKGITDPTKIPMKSKHLYGQAVDVFDPKLELTVWLKKEPKHLEEAELWCEEGNKNWVHFQSVSPVSGKRWFLP